MLEKVYRPLSKELLKQTPEYKPGPLQKYCLI